MELVELVSACESEVDALYLSKRRHEESFVGPWRDSPLTEIVGNIKRIITSVSKTATKAAMASSLYKSTYLKHNNLTYRLLHNVDQTKLYRASQLSSLSLLGHCKLFTCELPSIIITINCNIHFSLFVDSGTGWPLFLTITSLVRALLAHLKSLSELILNPNSDSQSIRRCP